MPDFQREEVWTEDQKRRLIDTILLDHGSESETRTKRIRTGVVLRRYLGKPSLDECGPEDFSGAQRRLLDAFKRLLNSLLK